jgi:hypothetical protein
VFCSVLEFIEKKWTFVKVREVIWTFSLWLWAGRSARGPFASCLQVGLHSVWAVLQFTLFPSFIFNTIPVYQSPDFLSPFRRRRAITGAFSMRAPTNAEAISCDGARTRRISSDAPMVSVLGT